MFSYPCSNYSFYIIILHERILIKMKKIITYIFSLTFCIILSFTVFHQIVYPKAIKSSSTVTEITLCADIMPDKSVQEPDDDIPHIQSAEPRDEPDNF